MDASKTVYQDIPLDKTFLSPLALRQPQIDSDQFKNLQLSLERHGQLTPVAVRPVKPDSDMGRKGMLFEMGNGAQRAECLRNLKKKTIHAGVNPTMSDTDIRLLQVAANLQGVNTTKKQYLHAMERFLAEKDATIEQLTIHYCQPLKWVQSILNLSNVHEDVIGLEQRGALSATLLHALANVKDKDTQLNLCKGCSATKGKSILQMKQDEALQVISETIRELTAEARGKEAVFTPKTVWIGKKAVFELAQAAQSAGLDERAEGILSVIGADKESLANQKKIWDAAQAEKGKKKAKAQADAAEASVKKAQSKKEFKDEEVRKLNLQEA